MRVKAAKWFEAGAGTAQIAAELRVTDRSVRRWRGPGEGVVWRRTGVGGADGGRTVIAGAVAETEPVLGALATVARPDAEDVAGAFEGEDLMAQFPGHVNAPFFTKIDRTGLPSSSTDSQA
ncbi:hypothetical protein SAFG77S_08417 [Streptomyces afghaniensis]|nr:helix-turn-helix domain-containing protein [Streptomyces afghaniensis]